MLRKCPAHTPSGKHNPRKPPPLTELQALLKLAKKHGKQFPKACLYSPGQQSRPNSHRGPVASNNLIVAAKPATQFFVQFDGTRTGPASANTLTVAFRSGKQYHWDGITSGQASQFFPGTDFNTTHTFTDETSISKALHYWNFTARKTFLHRAPDRTTAGPPQRKLIWNPTAAPTTQTVVLALAGVFSWTVQVLASNGRPPTGTLNFQYSAFSDSHTLVTGDAGLHTFTNPGTTNAGFPTVVNANFVGSGGFANSTWTPTQVTTISMPVETPTVIHISLGGPRAVDFPTDAVWYTRDGSLSVVVTGVSPNWIVTATSGSFIPGVPAKAWGFFSQYYGLGPSWL